MSLETLLEAAQFLEWSGDSNGNAKARVKPPTDFHRYAKSASKEVSKSETNGSDPSVSDGNSEDESGNKRRPGGAGTREVHNKLEKNRRAHLKDCFDGLKHQIPNLEDKKMSNLNILRCALKHIQLCKRKEKELEQEFQRELEAKLVAEQHVIKLQKELAELNIEVDISHFLASVSNLDETQSSASTATADNEEPILSDVEEDTSQPATKRLKMLLGYPDTPSILASSSGKEEDLRDEPIDVVTVTTSSSPFLKPVGRPKATGGRLAKLTAGAVAAKTTTTPTKSSNPPVVSLASLTAVLNPGQRGAKPTQQALRWAVDATGGITLAQKVVSSPVVTAGSSGAPVPSVTTPTVTTAGSAANSATLKMPVTQRLQQTLAMRAQKLQAASAQMQIQTQVQGQQVQGLQVQKQQVQAVPVHPTQAPAILTLATPTSAPRVTLATPTTLAQLRPTIAISPAMLPSLQGLLLAQQTSAQTPGATILTTANIATAAPITKTTTTTGTAVPTKPMLSTVTTAIPLTTLAIATPVVTTANQRVVTTATSATTATPAATVGNIGGLKQIITTPITQMPTAQIVTAAQLQALVAQQAQTNTQTALVSPTVTQITNIQGMQTVPLTQLVSPLTMMSPAQVQMNPGNLQIQQLSNVGPPQMLKTLDMTRQNAAVEPVLGVPVRPVIMVTVPSIVTSSTVTPSPVQVNIPATETS